ncbi:hypothetical protein [Halosaccharopolyspora lacisalsi]|uniref:hypothetical protein n=1 Tax=Halosaccharopolyspora lacisalsi TaxID=1000566 RepID=UPI0015FD4BC8|nr:hypothetical protein [Halosaccharopolyspora lacisalsi]
MGTLDLRAIQLMVPIQDRAATTSRSPHQNAVMSLMQDAGWFADCPGTWRTSVQITLDSGQDPTIRAAIPGMLQWLRQFQQHVFTDDSVAETDQDENGGMKPPVIDQVWNGPPCHRVTVHGTLVSWSLDALGWLAAFLAEAGAQHGVSTPTLITASRNEVDGTTA